MEIVSALFILYKFACLDIGSNDNFRNTRTRKDFKIAEVKVVIFCCCYVIYGFGASLAYSLSSAFSSRLETELIDYFECEKEYKIDRECSRSGFETFINPTLQILPWSMIALYPVTTLVYFMCNKKAMCNRFNLKHKVTKQLSTLVHPPPSAI